MFAPALRRRRGWSGSPRLTGLTVACDAVPMMADGGHAAGSGTLTLNGRTTRRRRPTSTAATAVKQTAAGSGTLTVNEPYVRPPSTPSPAYRTVWSWGPKSANWNVPPDAPAWIVSVTRSAFPEPSAPGPASASGNGISACTWVGGGGEAGRRAGPAVAQLRVQGVGRHHRVPARAPGKAQAEAVEAPVRLQPRRAAGLHQPEQDLHGAAGGGGVTGLLGADRQGRVRLAGQEQAAQAPEGDRGVPGAGSRHIQGARHVSLRTWVGPSPTSDTLSSRCPRCP
jgi:hypothetical protein